MSELALKLIAENKKSRSPSHDLRKCGLTGIPEELGELVWLEGLSFASGWFEFDGNEWIRRNTNNTGSDNIISSWYPGFSVFSKAKKFFSLKVKTSPIIKLTNLKILSLVGGFDKKSSLKDLTPLSGLTSL